MLTNVATLRASALELAGRIDRRASRRHGVARMGIATVVNKCFHNIIYQTTHVHRQRRAKDLECRCHDRHGSPCVGVCVVVALRAHRQTETVGKFIAERSAIHGILHQPHSTHRMVSLIEIILPEGVHAQCIGELVTAVHIQSEIVPRRASHVVFHHVSPHTERKAVDRRGLQSEAACADVAQRRISSVTATANQTQILVDPHHLASCAPVAVEGISPEIELTGGTIHLRFHTQFGCGFEAVGELGEFVVEFERFGWRVVVQFWCHDIGRDDGNLRRGNYLRRYRHRNNGLKAKCGVALGKTTQSASRPAGCEYPRTHLHRHKFTKKITQRHKMRFF